MSDTRGHPVSGVCAPLGFSAAGVAAGLKPSGKDDLAVVLSDTPAAAAAVFTTNQMAAAPIRVSREHVADGTARAVVVNSGNANACTGATGLEDARAMARAAAAALDVSESDVVVASTGVIGVPMPIDAVIDGIGSLAGAASRDGGPAAATAIMTTDTFPKEAVATVEVDGSTYSVGGMAKGAGMIRPDMATMLCFLTTDAPLSTRAAVVALRLAVDSSFHRITVDGETSTNDMCLLLANGAAGGQPMEPGSSAHDAVAAAVADVCGRLARMIVEDGEGATKLVEVVVEGARDEVEALAAARAVAESALFKCAVFGGDPNWGRVVSAVGASRAHVDPDAIEVRFGDVPLAQGGCAVPFDAKDAEAALAGREVEVVVDLNVGDARATILTCDLTHDYVRINAEYTT
jgi:glutamate N-acetyltransferase/amino-acid N-acetyltransferase